MQPKYIHIKETVSTNTYLANMASILPEGTVIYSTIQSAGRGQRGASWESEPGKNLTFSLLLKPKYLLPNKQFYISEAVSVAIVSVLSRYASGFSVKWPNDIYYNDKKISGILIEHSIAGNTFEHTVIGIGININQRKFVSDAPNPVSLAQIIGTDTDLDIILKEIVQSIFDLVCFDENTSFDEIHSSYLEILYRKDGTFHKFSTPEGEIFEAEITDVLPDGTLTLQDEAGSTRCYAFKEVSFII
jgi:biotin--[acetyl-coA-carboxylase] ligase